MASTKKCGSVCLSLGQRLLMPALRELRMPERLNMKAPNLLVRRAQGTGGGPVDGK